MNAVTDFAALNALGYGLSDCSTPLTLTQIERSLRHGGACTDTLVIKYTISDVCGNKTNVYQLQRINDSIAPALTGTWPSDVNNQNACLSGADISVVLSNEDAKALFTDCNEITVTHTQDTIVNACDWTIRRMYVIADACGNDVKDTIKVSGKDKTAPALTGIWPANIKNVNSCIDDSLKDKLYTNKQVKALFSDCSNFTVDSLITITGTGCGWTVTKTFTVKDDCGNIYFADGVSTLPAQQVSGSDLNAPVLAGSWPANPPAQNNCLKYADISGLKSAAEIAALYSDCSDVLVSYVQDTTGTSCEWTIRRTYTIQDSCGRTVTPSPMMSVSGKDNVKPTISGKLPELTVTGCSVEARPAAYASVAEMDALGSLTISDNCASLSELSRSYNDIFEPSPCSIKVIRTYTIGDNCGNTDTISQKIMIHRDSTFTISSVSTDTTVYCESHAVEENITKPVVRDACGEVRAPYGDPAVATDTVNCTGTKVFTYTYRNCEGDDTTWTFTYHIALPDVIAGVPADATDTVSCEADAKGILPDNIHDKCGNTIVPVIKDTTNTVVLGTGKVVYRYTYTDCAGHDSVYTLTRWVIPGSFSPELNKATTV